jgi:uncharacterized protein
MKGTRTGSKASRASAASSRPLGAAPGEQAGLSRAPTAIPRRAAYEVAAVAATALLHPVFVDVLHQRAAFVGLALAGWTSYLCWRVRREPDALQALGLRREGFGPAFSATSVFSLVTLAAMGMIAQTQHPLAFRWEMVVLLVLYPVWGLFQQLLVQGIFVRTVAGLGTGNWPKIAATVLAAFLFAAVHLPDAALAGATCALGAVFTLIYLRWRNIWPLGLYHGWLGVFFYYWVLRRDPWMDMLGPG